MASVIKTPVLPRLLGSGPAVTMNWAGRLVQTLTLVLAEYGRGILERLPADGTVRATAPLPLVSTTVSGLSAYPAASWEGAILYVSDGTSNKRLAVSDGTNWRFPDGNVVS